jgi:phosphoglycolate phosphatase
MAYDLVIFDFDGTLADSAGWTAGVFNDVAARYGYRCVSEDELQMLRGRNNREIVRYLGVPTWKLPFIATHMRKLIARDAAQIRLFDGVDHLLWRLTERGVACAVVSSNTEETIRRILGPGNAARIAMFECGASLFGKASKFRRVLKRSGVAADRAICIGDEARDIEAAAQAGLPSGAVTWGYATTDLLREHRPTLVFDTMDAIVDAVTETERRTVEGCQRMIDSD